ncbi:MAG: ornithine--oxo-acid transaminase [SAR86 cluster bacterium]|jgi:ornithine--oxo-acid transaminase|nr:ornithine--oxo-acid transaminase [SAR86 cluster bacterium]
MVESQERLIKKELEFSAKNYKPLPVVLSRGKGVWLWDTDGNKYLDMMSAYSAVSHGHAHPELIKVLHQQSKLLGITSRAFYTNTLGPFLEKLIHISGLEVALPMNTGAEAVETAIKAARRWAYKTKKVEANKAEIIVVEGNFHGRTITIISFSTDIESKEDFGPYTPGFITIKYDSIDSLKEAITKNTAALLVEPIQGEAGIVIPDSNWLPEARKVCTENNVLLILDEIQSGLGRTGKMFAFEHSSIRPDGLILGKALGGGLLPISCFLSTKEVMQWFVPGSHGSTFGGFPLAAAIGKRSLELIEEEKLVENSKQQGSYLLEELKKIQSPIIKQIRGKGLWIGVEIDTKIINGRKMSERLLRKGILSKETHASIIRFAPPLIIKKKEIDWAVPIIKETLKEIEEEHIR